MSTSATPEQAQSLANDYGALESIYRSASPEERDVIRRMFMSHAQATQQAATSMGVEPHIHFFAPDDPRRRPQGAPETFAPGMAGQAALRDQAEFGTPAVPMGMMPGPAFDPSGGITVPAAAFPPRGTSSRGGRRKGPLMLTDNYSMQTSHMGHMHGPSMSGMSQAQRQHVAMLQANARGRGAREDFALRDALARRGGAGY